MRKETRTPAQATFKGKKEIEPVFFTNKRKGQQRHSFKAQCHECKDFGHHASYCKKRNFCVYFKKSGHDVMECKNRPNKDRPQRSNMKAYQASIEDQNNEGIRR